MRVISGKYKGRVLKAVPGSSTRPTTDKVKESIFNMIGPYYDGGIALDLFGGSGGLGIEALSRGIDKVVFIDRDKKAISTIYQNIEICHIETDCIEVYRNHAERALKVLIKKGTMFDLILLDPPYKEHQLHFILSAISQSNLLRENGTIMVEHAVEVVLPEVIGKIKRIKQEKYGITAISIYQYE